MGTITLTDKKVRSLKAIGFDRMEICDALLPGFGVRVTPRGTKSFVLMYRYETTAAPHTGTVSVGQSGRSPHAGSRDPQGGKSG